MELSFVLVTYVTFMSSHHVCALFLYILVDPADTKYHLLNDAIVAQQCSRRTEALPSTLWPSHEGIIHLQTANINIEFVVIALPWVVCH